MHMMKLKYVFSICTIVAVLGFVSTAQAQACTSSTPCTLTAGAQFCAGLQGFFAGSTVTITGSASQSVKWSVWASSTNDPLNLNDRIFVAGGVSSVNQSGITVPFLNNGTVWVAPCVNNTSTQEISFSISLTSP